MLKRNSYDSAHSQSIESSSASSDIASESDYSYAIDSIEEKIKKHVERQVANNELFYIVFREFLNEDDVISQMITKLPPDEQDFLQEDNEEAEEAEEDVAVSAKRKERNILDAMCRNALMNFLLDTLLYHRDLLAKKEMKWFVRGQSALSILARGFAEYLFAKYINKNETISIDVKVMRNVAKDFLKIWIKSNTVRAISLDEFPDRVAATEGSEPEALSQVDNSIINLLERAILAFKADNKLDGELYIDQIEYYLYSETMSRLRESHVFGQESIDYEQIKVWIEGQLEDIHENSPKYIDQYVERVLYDLLPSDMSQEDKVRIEWIFSGFKFGIDESEAVLFLEDDYRYCAKFIVVFVVENQRLLADVFDNTCLYNAGAEIACTVIDSIKSHSSQDSSNSKARDKPRKICLNSSVVQSINQASVDNIINVLVLDLLRERSEGELKRYSDEVKDIYKKKSRADYKEESSLTDQINYIRQPARTRTIIDMLDNAFLTSNRNTLFAKALSTQKVLKSIIEDSDAVGFEKLDKVCTTLEEERPTLKRMRKWSVLENFGYKSKGAIAVEEQINLVTEMNKRQKNGERFIPPTPMRSVIK